MSNSLKLVYQKLVRARCPEDIFGELKGKSDKLKLLKHHYRYLVRQVHPDKNVKEQHMASEATIILTEFYNMAKEDISNGTYGSRNVKRYTHKTKMTFSVNGFEYNIFSECKDGDFCQVYYGERMANGDVENICLKVINDIDDKSLMLNESYILKNIQHKSLPVYLDTFQIEDGRMVNVLRRIENSYTLHDLKEHFPNGLPHEHIVWVMDRLLSVLGFLHINNVIHGSIEPKNIMITPHNHNGLLIDYVLAIPEAHLKGVKYVGLNDYSAPEITAGAIPHPASDMYSLGKSMKYMLDKNSNSELVQFIQEFLHDDPNQRRSDAWASWHELKDLRTKIFGSPNQFLELKVGDK